jgi:hypothetical protein
MKICWESRGPAMGTFALWLRHDWNKPAPQQETGDVNKIEIQYLLSLYQNGIFVNNPSILTA